MLKPARKVSIKVVQLFGSAIPNNRVDGSDLVRKFASVYGGETYYLHAPLCVENEQAKLALLQNQHIKETLALARQANIILTGIGSLESSRSPSQTWLNYLTRAAIGQLRQKGAVGHICAYHFDQSGHILDIDLHRGIIGIDLGLLQKIPLVVGVASGEDKVRGVAGALKGKFINVLITNDTTAEKVLQLNE